MNKQIKVKLGERSYPIFAGSGMSSQLGGTCKDFALPERLIIITDRNVAKYYLKPVARSLTRSRFRVTSIVVSTGEKQKSLRTATKIYTEMLMGGVGRSSAVVALGGGVIGDLAGFVAATYHRGIPIVQVPTTLLAQVDSAIGGKVGVNHPLGKNMVGAIHQPTFVWVDMDFLKTLPRREVVCGVGEIVKYGIIRNADLFHYIEKHVEEILRLDPKSILHVQKECALIKSAIVSEDERELGKRVILNCGHTIGHALEAAGNYRLLKHGEAVLLGLAAESFIAQELGLLQPADYERIKRLIDRIPIKRNLGSLRPDIILEAMSRDKKKLGTKNRFVLPVRIGETIVVKNVRKNLVEASLASILK